MSGMVLTMQICDELCVWDVRSSSTCPAIRLITSHYSKVDQATEKELGDLMKYPRIAANRLSNPPSVLTNLGCGPRLRSNVSDAEGCEGCSAEHHQGYLIRKSPLFPPIF